MKRDLQQEMKALGQTVLVLQGGGALGAYQAGAYEGMVEQGIAPDWVTGVSIGAINGALIAGNHATAPQDGGRLLWFVGVQKLWIVGNTAPYIECGNDTQGGREVRMSVKFYLTAILFVVFDIEAVFIYPWAVQFRSLGWLGLFEMFGFLGVVVVALVYVWRKGALEWES